MSETCGQVTLIEMRINVVDEIEVVTQITVRWEDNSGFSR
jgi:hypothetical protein